MVTHERRTGRSLSGAGSRAISWGRFRRRVPRPAMGAETIDHLEERRIEDSADLGFDALRQAAPERLGHAAGNGGLGVCVAAEGDGEAEGVHEVVGVEESDEGLGHGALAGDVEAVVGADGRDGAVEVVGEAGGDPVANLLLGRAGAGEVGSVQRHRVLRSYTVTSRGP